MAQIVLTDAFVSLGGTNVSDHVTSVTINYERDEVEATAMGDSTHGQLLGLKNWSIELEVQQDFAAASIDSILWNAVDTKATVAAIVRPTSAAKSATNPEYTATGYIPSYSPLSGSVGELATTQVRIIPAKGQPGLARATS
jgi:hypothetical protein